jgi:ribosomal protein S18 acetylase RimI-like enzyme
VHTRSWQSAYRHVFGDEQLAGIDVERRGTMWEGALADANRDVFLAEASGCVVGFVGTLASRDPDADGELGEIYAVPEAWGTGAGHALMAAALEALAARGYRDAILYVLADNPRARAFYEREGWIADGTERTDRFLGQDVREVRYRIELGARRRSAGPGPAGSS